MSSDVTSDEKFWKDTIEKAADPDRNEQAQNELRMRDLSLGVRPLPVGDPRDTDMPVKTCDYCSKPESDNVKLKQCSRCRMVSYCSAECQKEHWNESHKKACSSMTKENEEVAKSIVKTMKYNEGEPLSSVYMYIKPLELDESVYAMAVKHGLFPAIESLFRGEAAGTMEDADPALKINAYSWTQQLTTTIFKGNREVVERFNCMCPIRTKEFIVSSPTAWDSWMNATLYLARYLLRDEFMSARSRRDTDVARRLALAHRAARDVLVSLNLALIHKPVAKAIFFGSKHGAFRRDQEEANEYAMTLCSKLEAMFHNEGDGFAPIEVDHNQTIQANIFETAAMLAYWYRTLDVNPDDPELFKKRLQLSQHQDAMYETMSRPLGEGKIELGRELTMEELKQRSLVASKEYAQRKKANKAQNRAGRSAKKGRRNRRK